MRFKMVSFRGQLKFERRPGWSLLQVEFNFQQASPTIWHERFNRRLHHELSVKAKLCSHRNILIFRSSPPPPPPVPSHSTFLSLKTRVVSMAFSRAVFVFIDAQILAILLLKTFVEVFSLFLIYCVVPVQLLTFEATVTNKTMKLTTWLKSEFWDANTVTVLVAP